VHWRRWQPSTRPTDKTAEFAMPLKVIIVHTINHLNSTLFRRRRREVRLPLNNKVQVVFRET
jgi:hypothetical protein